MEVKVIDASLLEKMFIHGTSLLEANKATVDALNVFPVPDGDTGTNMSLTMKNAVSEMSGKGYQTVAEVSKAISKGSLMGARGNSGVILSQIFRGFAQSVEDLESMTVDQLAEALEASAQTAYKAVLKPVEGTILTVIRIIGERAVELSGERLSFNTFFEEVLSSGEKALANTPNQLPQLKQAGVVDAGGKGLLYILYGFYEVLCGRPVSDLSIAEQHEYKPLPAQAHVATEDINFTYCTEFIVRGENLANAPLKEDIIEMGDSMVYVPDDDLIKVHIHTNDPGIVMQKALKYGELIKIKIENMKEQHGTILGDHYHDQMQGEMPAKSAEKAKVAVVAVAMGAGMADILKDLGVEYIIRGGQTMNPSTADIQAAIESVNAEEVIVMPNNSNIIMAANQSAELSDIKVYVLPTKSVLQCISAMIDYDPEQSAEENFAMMEESMGNVKSIDITYAVRDTEIGDVEIKEGDYLAILNGEIVSSESDIESVVMHAIAKAVDPMSEFISLYYGEDISEIEAAAMTRKIAEAYPEVEVEVFSGQQPVYRYLISVE
ncbi:MAG: dihydroxyacetone kinase [Clostridiales bacterium]|nr:MAG: dihydroxyacetone kinase [Clostridiales bacterium]